MIVAVQPVEPELDSAQHWIDNCSDEDDSTITLQTYIVIHT